VSAAQGDLAMYSLSFIVFVLFFLEWVVLSVFQNQTDDRHVTAPS
jgi:hypothetical protein